MDAVTRSFKRMFQVPAMYWAIAMVVAAASALVQSGLDGLSSSAGSVDSTFPLTPVTFFVILAALIVLMGLVFIPLGAATTRAALAVFRNEPVRFEQVWAGFKRYGSVVGVGFVTVLPLLMVLSLAGGFAAWIMMGSGGPFASPEGLVLGVVGGLVLAVLLLIPAFYLILRWAFALFVLFDDDCGALEALRRSWGLTRDRFLSLFGVTVITGFAGALAGIAAPLLVFSTGWAPLAIGELYKDARAHAEPPVRDWERETWADLVVVRDDGL